MTFCKIVREKRKQRWKGGANNRTLGHQGKLEEAAAMKMEVLGKRRRILGEEHLDTISAMNNLAN